MCQHEQGFEAVRTREGRVNFVWMSYGRPLKASASKLEELKSKHLFLIPWQIMSKYLFKGVVSIKDVCSHGGVSPVQTRRTPPPP